MGSHGKIKRDSDRRRKSKKRSRSEEEIKDYAAKIAQKMALRTAKKLKTQSVSGYSNDSNPLYVLSRHSQL